MRSSLEAVLLILSWEQLRLKVYRDAGKKLTVGWGHLVREADRLWEGEEISRDRANSLFMKDLEEHEEETRKAINVLKNGITILSPDRFGALTSLCFNIGGTRFLTSTAARMVREGSLDKVPDAIRMWNKVQGRVSEGLVARREAECRLWEKG